MKDRFVSLGCSFRELLLSCDIVEAALLASIRDRAAKPRKDDIEFLLGQMLAYQAAIVEVVSYDECTFRPMAFTLSLVTDDPLSDGVDWINVNLFNWDYVRPPKSLPFDKWEDKHNQTFSATFSKWEEHAEREVLINVNALKYFRSLEEIVSEILWEITFNGFTGKDTAKVGEKVMDECKTAMDEFKLHPENFVTRKIETKVK